MMNVHFGAQITASDVAKAKANKRDRDAKITNPGFFDSVRQSKAQDIAQKLGRCGINRSFV